MTDTQALIEQLMLLEVGITQEGLIDEGRYFEETYSDLTQCGHGDTGEYGNRNDGKLIAFLWNNRTALTTALTDAEAKLAKAREALGWFLADEQFVVTVGGNPNVVEQMLYTARACLAELGEG